MGVLLKHPPALYHRSIAAVFGLSAILSMTRQEVLMEVMASKYKAGFLRPCWKTACESKVIRFDEWERGATTRVIVPTITFRQFFYLLGFPILPRPAQIR